MTNGRTSLSEYEGRLKKKLEQLRWFVVLHFKHPDILRNTQKKDVVQIFRDGIKLTENSITLKKSQAKELNEHELKCEQILEIVKADWALAEGVVMYEWAGVQKRPEMW